MIKRIKIQDKIVFYILNKSSSNNFSGGKAVYVEKEWGGKTYNVYRANISMHHYPKKELQLSSGWNLFKKLTLKEAIRAAKYSLRWID